MNQSTRNRSFQGRGSIYIQELNGSGARVPLGNCSELSVSISEESQDQNDYENPGGGVLDTLSRVSQVAASVTSLSLSPQNVALAMRALVNEVVGTAVVAEKHTAFKNAFVPFIKLPDTDKVITVTDEAGTTDYVLGVDYKIRNSGLLVLDGGSIADSSTIKVTYTSVTTYNIEGITERAKEYQVMFDGLNEADDNKPVRITFHRVRFSTADAMSFISDDFANIPLNFTVLKDGNIVGAGESQYIRIEQAA